MSPQLLSEGKGVKGALGFRSAMLTGSLALPERQSALAIVLISLGYSVD